MSVLKTIKDALNNVQQVGSSIKPLKRRSQLKTYYGVDGVDLDAGADLLNKFHEQWSDMHQQANDNARVAQKVDAMLQTQYDKCEQQAEALNQLMGLTAGLPNLLDDISQLVNKIGALQEQFSAVEDGLVIFQDVCEALEMATNKQHHLHQLSVYKQRRAAELEQIKVRLANEHAQKVEGHEAKLQEHLRVKQEAFEEAFAREMKNYRESGSTDMRPLLAQSPQHVELADIPIEHDNSALDAFLESESEGPECYSAYIPMEEEEDEDEEEEGSHVHISTDISVPDQGDLDEVTSEPTQPCSSVNPTADTT